MQRIVVACSSSTGMRLVVRLHEATEIDVRVALRRREARMSEELLDGAQVGAGAEEMGRERVAERVRRRLRGRAADEDVALHQARDAPAGEPAAAGIAEDRAARDRLSFGRACGAVSGERA